MATTIPLGFHIWSLTFTVAGSTHNNVVTCGGKNSGFLTAASINTVWRNAFCIGANKPFNTSFLSTGWTVVESKVMANIGGLLYVDINTATVVGAGPANPPSMNVAILVKKDVGISGRPYQARFFSPPTILEVNVDAAGQIAPAEVTALNTRWANAYNELQTNLMDPCIIHNPSTGLIPTKINSFTVRSRVGTIGRRMRR